MWDVCCGIVGCVWDVVVCMCVVWKWMFEYVEGNYVMYVRVCVGVVMCVMEKMFDVFVEVFGELEKVSDLKREDGVYVLLLRMFVCVKGDWEWLFGNLR